MYLVDEVDYSQIREICCIFNGDEWKYLDEIELNENSSRQEMRAHVFRMHVRLLLESHSAEVIAADIWGLNSTATQTKAIDAARASLEEFLAGLSLRKLKSRQKFMKLIRYKEGFVDIARRIRDSYSRFDERFPGCDEFAKLISDKIFMEKIGKPGKQTSPGILKHVLAAQIKEKSVVMHIGESTISLFKTLKNYNSLVPKAVYLPNSVEAVLGSSSGTAAPLRLWLLGGAAVVVRFSKGLGEILGAAFRDKIEGGEPEVDRYLRLIDATFTALLRRRVSAPPEFFVEAIAYHISRTTGVDSKSLLKKALEIAGETDCQGHLNAPLK